MKKILILNGSHSELPLIRGAKALGLHVITTGNAPHLVGHREAHEYRAADYTDAQAVLQLAREAGIDYICSCANDGGIVTAAYVAEARGLPGHDPYETTLLLHHKDRFKAWCRTRPVPTPAAMEFRDLASALDALGQLAFPLIVKPVDMAGGKGVSRAHDRGTYRTAVEAALRASPSSTIVVEEFIEGSQHSFSTFLAGRKVVATFSDDEHATVNPYTVSTSAAPAHGVELVADELVWVSEAMADELRLVDGVFHHQYILREGRAHILEITRRCSGDLYAYPVQHALGVDWGQWIVKAAMGLDCRDFPKVEQKGFCGRHCIQATRNGVLRGFHIDEALQPHIFDRVDALSPGDLITNHLSQKLAVLMLRFDSREQMDALTPRLQELAQALVDG